METCHSEKSYLIFICALQHHSFFFYKSEAQKSNPELFMQCRKPPFEEFIFVMFMFEETEST